MKFPKQRHMALCVYAHKMDRTWMMTRALRLFFGFPATFAMLCAVPDAVRAAGRAEAPLEACDDGVGGGEHSTAQPDIGTVQEPAATNRPRG